MAERDPLLDVLLKPEYGVEGEAGGARGKMVNGFEKRPLVSECEVLLQVLGPRGQTKGLPQNG